MQSKTSFFNRTVYWNTLRRYWVVWVGYAALMVLGMGFSFTAQDFAARGSVGFTTRLRQALFYRIATILIRSPARRERVEDIEELAYHHLRENAARYTLGGQKLAPETLEALRRYRWPGNVRELYHALDYALNVCSGETLLPEHLPETVTGRDQTAPEKLRSPEKPARV